MPLCDTLRLRIKVACARRYDRRTVRHMSATTLVYSDREGQQAFRIRRLGYRPEPAKSTAERTLGDHTAARIWFVVTLTTTVTRRRQCQLSTMFNSKPRRLRPQQLQHRLRSLKQTDAKFVYSRLSLSWLALVHLDYTVLS